MSLKVALLDSGIAPTHPHIRDRGGKIEWAGDWASGVLSKPREPHADEIGHGTAAAAAILDLCPGLTLLSVRIFGSTPRTSPTALAGALRAAFEAGPRIINLSLGSVDARLVPALASVVETILETGILLVAPAEVRGLAPWPGSLPGVQGVLVDPHCPRDQPRREESSGRIRYWASPYPRDVDGLPRERNFHGPSFACANVTGFLARELAAQDALPPP